jgi:predicted branched-subunit amino acid permease
VVAITLYEQAEKNGRRRWYFLGAGLTLWTTWQVVTAAGVFLSTSVPANLPLDFALPLVFIALLVPVIRDRAGVAAALTAGIVVLLSMALPFRLNLLLAAAAGLVAGLRVEAITKR